MRRAWSLLLSSALILSPFTLLARSFSDVPRTSPYYADIDELSEQGAITGNPDGTFKPGVPVNRAAMLVMTYRAAGKLPTPRTTQCFARETLAEWYAAYVCDAFEKQYVQGIGGDRFGADQPVTFEQAAKIVSNVFEMNVPETFSDTILTSYVHVSKTGWSAKYIAFLVRESILPLPGISPPDFHPGDPMSRGPVASLVNKARKWRATHPQQISSSLGTSVQSSAAPAMDLSASLLRPTPSSSDVRAVRIPFDHSSVFDDKRTKIYNISVDQSMVVDFTATLGAGMRGIINCRLFRMPPDGIPWDYNLGHVEGSGCHLKTAVYAGNYSFQVSPTVGDVTYDVTAKKGEGDGNDALTQAVRLEKGVTYPDILGSGDIEDWFVLTLRREEELTVAVDPPTLGCLVHSGPDVDYVGFDIPDCNRRASFPAGTHYFVVKHSMSKDTPENVRMTVQ